MNIDNAIALADDLLLQKTGQQLTTLDKLVLKGSLEHKSYKEIAASTYRSPRTIKDIGAQLWRKLAHAFETPVKKGTVGAVLERYQHTVEATPAEIVPAPPSRRRDWADAPEVETFFGREEELATLNQWIVRDRCRLVAIVGMRGMGKTGLTVRLGMGGIGKTDLSLRLARGIQDDFDYVIWRSLLNAPSIHDILNDFIQGISSQPDIRLPKTVEGKTRFLLDHLKARRCLLVLDNLESILAGYPDPDQAGTKPTQGGHYREGCEGYGHLLQKIAEVPHQSCLILTSREQPKHLQAISSTRGKTRFLQLSGLDINAAKNIFIEQGILPNLSQKIEEIVDFYEGNPLALNLVIKRIQNIFSGSISDFIKNENPCFGDINELLDWHFLRLSEAEKEILLWLTINREATSISTLHQDTLSLALKTSTADVVESLVLRLPIQKTALGFTLQPVIFEYVTEKIIQTSFDEIRTGEFSLLNQVCLHKAAAKTYIRHTQVRLFLVPLLDRLLLFFKDNSAIIQTLNLALAVARKSLDLRSGYIAGNLISLLRQLEVDLSGYDFSHLAIRQAFLQAMPLQNTNFKHCDLSTAVFTRSFGGVHSVAFSPDNQQLAIGDCKGQIRLLNQNNCQQTMLLSGHIPNYWITSLAFSKGGDILVSSSWDKTAKIWDLTTGQCLFTLAGHNHLLWAIAISPNSRWVASSGDDGTVRLWCSDTGNCASSLIVHTNWVWALDFHPGSALLASGSFDCTVRIWNVQTGDCTEILEECHAGVLALAFSPSGDFLAIGGVDRTISFWDMVNRQYSKVLEGHTKEVRSLVFTPDGKILISGGFDGILRFWDVESGQCIKLLSGHAVAVRSVDISSDGKLLASGDHGQTLRLWDAATGECLQTLKGHVRWVWPLSINPDINQLVTGGLDGNFHLWNLQTNDIQQTIKGHGNWIWQVKHSPCKTYFATCSCTDDETLKLWHAGSGQWLATLEGHKAGGVWTIDFSPDGTSLVSGGQDGTVRMWDLQSYNCQHIVKAHNNWVWSVVFNQQGNLIATCSDDGTVKIWSAKTLHLQHSIELPGRKILSLAWIGNSKIVASGCDDGLIRLWDASTGKHIRSMEGHQQWVLALAYDRTNHTLISGAQDNTIRLWDLENIECFAVLRGHSNWVTSIDLDYEEHLAITGSADGTVKIWDMDSKECQRTLKISLPYEGMDITHAVGLNDSQKANLQSLGALITSG